MNKTIWIIGAGNMSQHYSKVLNSLNYEYTVIGRGEKSAKEFEKTTGIDVVRGGVEDYIRNNDIPDFAIVAVYPNMLSTVTECLVVSGVKRILVEKPGGLTRREIARVAKTAKEHNSKVYIAYNRRFFASTIQAKKIIEEDGGVSSFNFEFTEWEHVIRQYGFPKEELEAWFLANSTHVVDLAYFLGGIPETISCYVEGVLDWHPVASRYSGAGRTREGALFSYKANWGSAGRWSIEVLTKKQKVILEPLESLKVMKKGSINIEPYDIDNSLDEEFKPGLYLQTKAFLDEVESDLISVEKHAEMAKIYELMETNGTYLFDK